MVDTVLTSKDDVFINCPFDDGYTASFRALVFTIMACGFRPRSARELDDAGQTRIDKIYGLIKECRFGIHDISRTELDPVNNLPRFNMPFELGIFLGAKKFGGRTQVVKRVLVFDTEQFRYQRFISDLAGVDIQAHNGDPVAIVRRTRDWLANVSRRQLPSSNQLRRVYDDFLTSLPVIAHQLEFELDRIPYVDFERILAEWLVSAPALPPS